MDESTSAGLEWTLDEENEILPDDSLADVQLSRAVQEMLWQWPRGKVLLRVSAKGMKEHQRQRVRAALLGLDGAKQQLVVAVEVVKEADLEVVVRDLRACGGATQPFALASAPSSRAVPEPLDRGSSAPLSSVLQHTVMPTHDRLIERPVRVLGTLDLFRKNIVLLGNAEFVATLLPDPYLITTL
ncbi:hypothetical protein FVE85_1902 [Porphyridium purpureum]|uniref:Uncharacterized protein n=1 Tax=Porphyridium purpureum TaxID=35688 RepID=A0A5J4YZ64_PORPP|nr:hypothetical protein FVE85_1902 [Porphyridium purpureum]|eukprot:POR8923..scf209_3